MGKGLKVGVAGRIPEGCGLCLVGWEDRVGSLGKESRWWESSVAEPDHLP